MQLSMASSHSILLVLVDRARARSQAPNVGVYLGRAWSSTKLKSANIFVHAGFGQFTKFISRQIFQLYGNKLGPIYS